MPIQNRKLEVGTRLVGTYKKEEYACTVEEDGAGKLVYVLADGRRFQSPFASPPGVGESPPLVNVLWGLANFAGGFALIFGVGYFRFELNRAVMMLGLGALVASVLLALYLGRVRKG